MSLAIRLNKPQKALTGADYCFRGAYGTYGIMCARLAQAAGYPTQGRGQKIRVDLEMLQGTHASKDILFILLTHSDSDGFIDHHYCFGLLTRMLNLCGKIRDPDVRQDVVTFAAGLMQASVTSTDVVYC